MKISTGMRLPRVTEVRRPRTMREERRLAMERVLAKAEKPRKPPEAPISPNKAR